MGGISAEQNDPTVRGIVHEGNKGTDGRAVRRRQQRPIGAVPSPGLGGNAAASVGDPTEEDDPLPIPRHAVAVARRGRGGRVLLRPVELANGAAPHNNPRTAMIYRYSACWNDGIAG